MKEPLIGRWWFHFRVGKDQRCYGEKGWFVFSFAIFKLRNRPPEGMMVTKTNYKGFWLRFKFWIPFDFY